ncbi:MAG: tetratricopeptide repeat protein, partial [Burkholderiales bacterium]
MISPVDSPAEQTWQLARAHYEAGRLDAAEQACLGVLDGAPEHAEALHLLGVVARLCGDISEAERCFRAALAVRPAFAAAHNNLGIALCEIGHLPDAEEHFREASRLEPAFADAHNNLGNLLQERGRSEEAGQSLRRAIELRPAYAEAHANLGIVLRSLGRLQEAEGCARRATEIKPDYAEAYNAQGVALFGLGRLQEAEQSYRKALALDPTLAVVQGNLVYLMNCVSGRSLMEIYAEHREFAARFCPPADPVPHQNTADPERRLRVGYVSGDFRHHSVAFFIEAVLAAHDRKGIEVFCYYNQAHTDGVTERLQGLADHWREVHALDDASFAQLVCTDGIDILVDLSGYTANNRLPVFARKPAPVQATWLGYLNTTGLDAIDYRISDAHANPPGPLDGVHSERLLRLPDSQW